MILHVNPALIFAAAGLLLLGHIARAARWALLFPSTYLTQRYNLLLGLGIGYLIDIVMPWRIGEIVRVMLVHRRDHIRLSHVAATVYIERVTDLVAVSIILSALLVAHDLTGSLSWIAPAAMAAGATIALVATVLVRRSLSVRRIVWRLASLFNDRIRAEIADFCWSAAEIATGRTLLGWRYVLSSIIMWAIYLPAYYVFAEAVGLRPIGILNDLLTTPCGALVQNVSNSGVSAVSELFVLFALVPIVAITLYGTLPEQRRLATAWHALRSRGTSGVGAPLAARKRFEAAHTYDYFLASLFSGTNHLLTGFSLAGLDDCIIHKFYNGGSDAVTALVTVNQRLFIRKFAVGGAALKLKVQADWLDEHSSGELPLVTVGGARQVMETFQYDMPLVTPSNDFYDVIHTSPAAHSAALLKRVIEQLVEFHVVTRKVEADRQTIARYLNVKAIKNAETILSFARSMLPTATFVLNGRSYDLAAWDRLLDLIWLENQITDRRVACVHGDLTIENIIVAPEYPMGFYIIDPNSENIFDSPLIDWAKLMQSLHLGYETLNQGISCTVSNDVVRLASVRSQAYAELHHTLESEARARLGPDAVREIYFHEIVNYLRLTTYKIRQSPTRGFGFFACTAMLLDRYCERWN